MKTTLVIVAVLVLFLLYELALLVTFPFGFIKEQLRGS